MRQMNFNPGCEKESQRSSALEELNQLHERTMLFLCRTHLFLDEDCFFEDFFLEDFFLDDFFFGAFPPSFRASDSPMAIACFLLVTFLPDLPLFRVPSLRSCIAFLTFFCAFLPYFATAHLLSYFKMAND
jgi:hypothetical protein